MLVGRHFEKATRFLDMSVHHADVRHINVWLNDFFSPNRTIAFSEEGCAGLMRDNSTLFALQMAYIMHMGGGRKSAARRIHVYYVVPDSNVNAVAVEARRRLSVLGGALRTSTLSQAATSGASASRSSVAENTLESSIPVGSRRSSVVVVEKSSVLASVKKTLRQRTSTADNVLLLSVESVKAPSSAHEFQQALSPSTRLNSPSDRHTAPLHLSRPLNNQRPFNSPSGHHTSPLQQSSRPSNNQRAFEHTSRRNSLSNSLRLPNATSSRMKDLNTFTVRSDFLNYCCCTLK